MSKRTPIYHQRVSAAVIGLRKREYYPVICGTPRAGITTSIEANVTCKRCLRIMRKEHAVSATATETLEEIAERISKLRGMEAVRTATLSALRNERERCAKVADTIQHGSRTLTAKNTAMTIAVIIREGK